MGSSTWLLERVRTDLLRYHPTARAWEERSGVAVDLKGAGRTDLFVYDRGFKDLVALKRGPSDEFVPTGFPFKGRMLPDSDGKITSVMFATNNITNRPIREFLRNRSGLKCQILHLAGHAERRLTAPRSADFSFFEYTDRECDVPPCGGGMWVQNELLVGRNESNELIASASTERGMRLYVSPLVQTLGAIPYQTEEYTEAGNLLSSSTHLFFPQRRKFQPGDNFVQQFASERTLVAIDDKDISSASDLDMILTPTEETRNGKPVVFVAEGVPWYRNRKEQKALDEIADSLQERAFHVERIPYIYTGSDDVFFREGIAFSYNNCLMERYREQGRLVRRVYLPWYQNYRFYNRRAAAVFQKYGYDVVPIRGLEASGAQNGSLRCMVKVTDRSF